MIHLMEFDATLDKNFHAPVPRPFYRGFHSGSIISMDICTHRPLIATACRADYTIKLWNY